MATTSDAADGPAPQARRREGISAHTLRQGGCQREDDGGAITTGSILRRGAQNGSVTGAESSHLGHRLGDGPGACRGGCEGRGACRGDAADRGWVSKEALQRGSSPGIPGLPPRMMRGSRRQGGRRGRTPDWWAMPTLRCRTRRHLRVLVNFVVKDHTAPRAVLSEPSANFHFAAWLRRRVAALPLRTGSHDESDGSTGATRENRDETPNLRSLRCLLFHLAFRVAAARATLPLS